MKYPLFSLLLVATSVSLAIALWLERSRPTENLYLHLYSNRYDIYSNTSDLPKPPRPMQCIATLSLVPGFEFDSHFPNHYEPEMWFRGRINRSGDTLFNNFFIDLADSGLATTFQQEEPLELGEWVEFWDGEFRYCISDRPEPPVATP